MSRTPEERIVVLEDWRERIVDPERAATAARLQDGDGEFAEHRRHIDTLYDTMSDHLRIEHGLQDVNLRKPMFRPTPDLPHAPALTPGEAVRQAQKDSRETWEFWLGTVVKVAILVEAVIVAIWLIAKYPGG